MAVGRNVVFNEVGFLHLADVVFQSISLDVHDTPF